MKLTEFSVKNRLLIDTISVVVFVMGVLALIGLKTESFPNINFNRVTITTVYPNSTASEVEKWITIPIEDEIKQVDDIEENFSISAEGISVFSIKIDEETQSLDRVVNDIQRAVDRVTDFPDDLEDKPIVTEIKTDLRPIITVSLSGEMPYKDLREHAKALEDRLLDLNNTAKVNRAGYREPEIWVLADSQKLRDYQISLGQIATALASQNLNIPGGEIYFDNIERKVRTNGEFKDVADVKKVVVRANLQSQKVLVKDLATVIDTFEEEKIIHRTKAKSAVNLTVVKKSSADIIDLVAEVRQTVTAYQNEIKDDRLAIDLFDDNSFFIKRRLNVLFNNGALGMVLVVISLFVFLSARVAISALMGIPLAILMTFLAMSFLGVSINLLSMFGMIMVIGMLVDEEIVIAENIYRHLENGDNALTATVKGAQEVSVAVIASVATTVAAFIPLFMLESTSGKFIRHIPVVVNITLISSLIVALFILPTHIHWLTKNAALKGKIKTKQSFQRFALFYRRILTEVIKLRYLALLVLGLILAGSIYRALKMPQVFLPGSGLDRIVINMEGPKGLLLGEMNQRVAKVEEVLFSLKEEEYENFVTQVGILAASGRNTSSNRGSYLANITIYLTPEVDRKRDTQTIIQDLREQTQSIGIDWERLTIDQPKRGSEGKPVEILVRGDEFSQIRVVAERILSILKQTKGVVDIQSELNNQVETIEVTVDYKRLAQAQLTVRDVAMTVRTAFEGRIATRIKKSDEEIDVRVRLPITEKFNRDNFENLTIANPNGRLIPLTQVANINIVSSLNSISRDDGKRVIKVTSNVVPDQITPTTVMEKLNEQQAQILEGFPSVDLVSQGEDRDLKEVMSDMLQAVWIAMGLIFIILVAVFRSLSMTFIILATTPFALVGIVVGLSLGGLPISLMALLGSVGLIGVIANSGIIVIDFIQKARKQGAGKVESVLDACQKRLRAVILTSVTTALGVIPAAYGFGGLDPFIQPMALVLNYGLIFGALLSLFFVPCMVLVVDDIKGLFSRSKAGVS